jgi:Virulence activator alpha C-term
LRLFMLWLVESPEAIAFDDEIEIHRQRLAGFEQTLAYDERDRREHGTAQGGIAFCASLALEWGLRYEHEYIEWATQARDRNRRRRKRLGRNARAAARTAQSARLVSHQP